MKVDNLPECLKIQDKCILTCLNSVEEAVKTLWNPPLLQHYTKHGLDHSQRIIDMLGKLLGEFPDLLNEHERFILLASVYLHDIGMQSPHHSGLPSKPEYTIEEKEKIREIHHEISAKMIYESISKRTLSLGLEQCKEYADFVAEVSRYHRELDLSKVKDTTLAGEKIQLQLLAALLRLGDALDADFRRVNMKILGLREIPIESKYHWWVHHYVRSILIEKGYIKVYFRFPEEYREDRITEVFRRKVEKSISDTLVDVYKVLYDHGIRLYPEIETEGEMYMMEGSLELIPPDLLEYIMENVVKVMERSETLGMKTGTVWLVDEVPFSDNINVMKCLTNVSKLIEGNRFNDAVKEIERCRILTMTLKEKMIFLIIAGNYYFYLGKLKEGENCYKEVLKIFKREDLQRIYGEDIMFAKTVALQNINLIHLQLSREENALKADQDVIKWDAFTRKGKKREIGKALKDLTLSELLGYLKGDETREVYVYRLGRYVEFSPATINTLMRKNDYHNIQKFKETVEKFLKEYNIYGVKRDDISYIVLVLDDIEQLEKGISSRSPELWLEHIVFLIRHLQNVEAATWERRMFCCIIGSILSHLLPSEASVKILSSYLPPFAFSGEQYSYYIGIVREYYFNLTEVYLSLGENEKAFQLFARLEPLCRKSSEFLILKERIKILKCNIRMPGVFREIMDSFERAFSISEGRERTIALFNMGLAHYRRGDFKEAEKAWRQCLKLEHFLDRRIVLYHNIANIFRLSGNHENAKKFYEKSIDLAEIMEEKEEKEKFRVKSLIGLANVLIDLCLWKEAEAKLREVIQECAEKGFLLTSAIAKTNLGTLLGRKGKYKEALECHTEALDLVDREYNSHEYSIILTNLGDIFRQLKMMDEALFALEEAFKLTKSENVVLVQAIEIGLAELFFDMGNFDKSRKLAHSVLQESWLDNRHSEAEARRIQGKILLHKKKFQDAKESLEESKRIFKKLNLKYELLEVFELLKVCCRNLKDLEMETHYRTERKILIQQIGFSQ